MKVLLMIGVAALMLPALAPAAAPIDGATLGQIEAKRDFCDHVDPSGSKDRAGFLNVLIGQFSAEELQATRDSDSYKESYQQTSSQLSQLEPKSASSACAIGAR